MDVERGADLLDGPFGHEGDGQSVQSGDLLGAVLVDGVTVGHLQRVGVVQVDLVLAEPPLAFGGEDRDAGAVHARADLADNRHDSWRTVQATRSGAARRPRTSS